MKAAVSGWIASIDAAGRIFVDFEGNAAGPLPARSIVDIHRDDLPAGGAPAAVLLEFDRGDASAPIILGLLREARIATKEAEKIGSVWEGEHLLFNAQKEIQLRCGEGSITLRADGRVVIKGTQLVSRATEGNRIRGASVAIN